jgi:transcriptional regulator with XRE-family HTH domain
MEGGRAVVDRLPPSGSDVADEPVGVLLARWRKRKGIAGQMLGERVGMSQAKISRLETGATIPDPHDVRRIARALELPEAEVERLVELADHTSNQLTDWRPTQLGLADRQHDVKRLESSSREFRVFQPAVVVGLLQTSEYARALMTAFRSELGDSEIADSTTAVSEAVTARVQRHQVLTETDRHFYFVMSEAVLSNRVCRPAEMIAQIERLREVARQDNVTLRIVPADAQWPIAPYHGFEVMDDRCVLVDLFNTSLMSRGRRVVRHYRNVFDALERAGTTDISRILTKYQRLYAQMLLPDAAA